MYQYKLVRHQDSQSDPAQVQRLGRYSALAGTGKCTRAFSLYSRCVSVETRRRRPYRMFAGEGGPERTNKRFHYVSIGPAGKAIIYSF